MHEFKTDIQGVQKPKKFTYPFCYEPHMLVEIASKELQDYLLNQKDFSYNFGVRDDQDGKPQGKMFGVLIVEMPDGKLGYLVAFSGKLGKLDTPKVFVPPVYDINLADSFYKKGEAEVDKMTNEIDLFLRNSNYLKAKNDLSSKKEDVAQKLESMKKEMREKKAIRKLRRKKAEKEMLPKEFEKFNNELAKESISYQNDYKRLSEILGNKIAKLGVVTDTYEAELKLLKQKRKAYSSSLQKEIFEKYRFLNINGKEKKLTEIFPEYEKQKPPGGSGDCSAPKLLQYAFLQSLKPIAMGEFWWGVPHKAEVRRHKFFYPACNKRCKPILGHMLEGVDLDDDPLKDTLSEDMQIEVVFEDDDIVVVNKPSEMLSVPGKLISDSVQERVKELYPDSDGPLIVHRLDMSTSGLLMIAKNKSAHKNLQSQFLERTINKRYVAVVEGEIEGKGEINLPLRVDLDDRPRQLVCFEHGKPARTKWKAIRTENGRTRLYLYPITGRTHQLRVHLAHHKGLDCPIIGDDLYGRKADRLHLHAEYIQLRHPRTDKKISFTVAPDF